MHRANYHVAVAPIEMAAARERHPAQFKRLTAAWKTHLTLQKDAAEDPPPLELLQQRRRERGISPSTCCRPLSPRETRANTTEWQVARCLSSGPTSITRTAARRWRCTSLFFEFSDEWWLPLQSRTGLRIFTHYCRVNFSPLVSMVSSA